MLSSSDWSRLDSWRRPAGGLLAMALFGLVLWTPAAQLSPQAHRLAAVMSAVVVLWICEVLPLPVTAMAGCATCVVLQVAPAKAVFAPFAEPLMFLFIGSFMLARAIVCHGLDRRLAYTLLAWRWVDGRPDRILFMFGAVTAGVSAWISNTATTAMMFPIALAIVSSMAAATPGGGERLQPGYATALMLITSFAASVGGLATPIGTPPNLIGLGFIRTELGLQVPFVQWMLLGTPVVVALYLFMFVYLNWLCPAGIRQIAGGRALLDEQRRGLGPWTTGQQSTLAAFALAVCLWVLPGVVAIALGTDHPAYRAVNASLPEGVVAIAAATLLFLLPGNHGRRALDWAEAERIEWGVVLLYGGGLALGQLSNDTGLAQFLGSQVATLLPAGRLLAIVAGAAVVATIVSELTSNTASATIVVPLAIAVARAAGVDPAGPALAATFSASLGFMLPVSTPCNAIVYSSGHIPLGRMARYGVLLDLAGVVVIVLLVTFLAPLVLSPVG